MTDSLVTAMSVKVYFGGLTGEASQTEAAFRALLSSQDVGVEPDAPVSLKSGYAFASYNDSKAADDAIAKFNGTNCVLSSFIALSTKIGWFYG